MILSTHNILTILKEDKMADLIKKLISIASAVAVMSSTTSMLALAEDEDSNVNNEETVEQVIVGGYDFNDFSDYIGSGFLQTPSGATLDVGEGVQIGIGARNDANGTTGWYTSTVDADHGSSGQANIGQYVSAARGPYLNITIPATETAGKRVGMSWEYYPTNGTNNTADLIIYDPTAGAEVATLVVGDTLNENEWNTIEIMVETSGSTMLIVNNRVVACNNMTASTYPQIKFTEINSGATQSRGSIDNIVLYTGGQLSDEQKVAFAMNDINLDTTQSSIELSEDGFSYNVTDDFTLPTTTSADVSWSVNQRAMGSTDDNWTESNFVAINGTNATINPTDEVGNYEVKLVAHITSGEASEDKEFILNLMNPINEINEVLESGYEKLAYADAVDSRYTCSVCGNIYQAEDGVNFNDLPDDWTCPAHIGCGSDKDAFTETESDVYTCQVCGYTYAVDTGDESIGIPAGTLWNDITDFACPGPVCGAMKSQYVATLPTYDLTSDEVLKADVVFPNSVSGHKYVTIKWSISDETYLSIDRNMIGVFMTDDLTVHNLTITATVVYEKGDITYSSEPQEYNISIGFTEDDVNSDDAALDKYKVRFDAACEENFEDIPTTTSSDIELPTEGLFGSTIRWTSNAPTVISNSGSVTRQNSNRDVTLTASIMSGAASETKTFEVTVRGKSSSSSSGSGSGGSVSSVGGSSNVNTGGAIAGNNSGVITTPPTGQEVVDELIQQREEAENRFTDIGSVSWARDAINGLYDAGIINGKTETTFAPNDNVTRAEFAKMLMGVFGLNSDAFTTSSFYDVSTSDWYFQSVESAYNLGIINGVAPAYFDPNANITRQDMAVMVVRAATVSGKAIPTVNEAKTFADEASIADYAKDAVSTLQVGGIIDGVTDTTFAPTDNATRAQAAKILYSFL